ncbi:MAG: protein translocase subunit SecF [Dehalococcoidales bacterium]|jgi:preprotein translocase subunit SecF
MFNLTRHRFKFFLISAVVILVGIISLATIGLELGIEFQPGSQLRLRFEDPAVTQSLLKTELGNLGHPNAIIQSEIKPTETGDFLIRTREITGEEKVALVAALEARFGALTVEEFNHVSPEVATETGHNAGYAVLAAAIGILIYVTWAFRRMPKPFHYGTCGVIALVHDVLVVVGVFSLLGAVLHWQVNLMFITGVLAVIGYSINNTVVVFDRIRENLLRTTNRDFETVVNNSLIETIGRSLNTSLTTLFVVVALLLFVGTNILNFAAVLLIGIIAGTYSSMFIAPLFLLAWEKKEWQRLIVWRAQKS